MKLVVLGSLLTALAIAVWLVGHDSRDGERNWTSPLGRRARATQVRVPVGIHRSRYRSSRWRSEPAARKETYPSGLTR